MLLSTSTATANVNVNVVGRRKVQVVEKKTTILESGKDHPKVSPYYKTLTINSSLQYEGGFGPVP